MKPPRILVAGIGNIFLGDDAFGVEVAQRLMRRELPEEVRVVDFGIRGLDLVYTLLDGYEIVILVDATPCGGVPGTLYVLEPQWNDAAEAEEPPSIETHNLNPVKVLRLASTMGAKVDRLLLVGCEPVVAGDENDMRMEMSEAVRAAVEEAVLLIESLVERLLRGEVFPIKFDPVVPG